MIHIVSLHCTYTKERSNCLSSEGIMEINFKEYYLILRKRWWIVVLCVLLFTILTSMYSNANYQPIYQASSKLIVNTTLAQDLMGKEQIDFGAIGINIALTSTYKEIIKSPAIMDKVLQRYPDLNLSTEQLISIVNISNLNETQVMTIVARHSSYEKAVKIVNAVSDVFKVEIPKIMKVDNVTILNRVQLQNNPIPVNEKSNQTLIMSLAAALIVAFGIILLLEVLDDTLKTDEDICQIFEVSSLTVIPKMKKKDFRSVKRNKIQEKAGEAAYATIIN